MILGERTVWAVSIRSDHLSEKATRECLSVFHTDVLDAKDDALGSTALM